MSERLIRVLQITAERGRFDLDAAFDLSDRPTAFCAWTQGRQDSNAQLSEEPETLTPVGPLTWLEVVDQYLRRDGWFEQEPEMVHVAIAERLRRELPLLSDETRARWTAALDAAKRPG